MKRATPKDVKEYIAMFPKETQTVLKQIQSTIKKAAPGAKQKISYGIPAFTLNDRNLIYFAGFKNHTSIYPAPRGHEKFKEELSKYKGGKGTIQFPIDEKLPLGLITRIVKFKIKESNEKEKMKALVKKAGKK
jgi:uncharacterized protein YdhG (YjbR/CyaY superfamily)